MGVIDKAVALVRQIAADNSHGYAWGGWGPDYDCGHLIIDAWERAGVPVKSGGASYTGNMPAVFLRCGFKTVNGQVNLATGAGLQAGDVLVNVANHAAMYVGGGMIVQARSNLDGLPGDSSGQEIREQGYYNYPWDYVLRYAGAAETPSSPVSTAPAAPAEPVEEVKYCTVTVMLPVVEYGDKNDYVKLIQQRLVEHGYSVGIWGIDGDFGNATKKAILRFQADHGLEQDAVCGQATYKALLEAVK